MSTLEPRGLSEEDDRRPDIDVQLGDQRYLVDVTIRNPTCPSNVNKASRESLAVAAAAERQKVNKYKDVAEFHDATFIPFVLESYGGLGKAANNFLNDLIATAKKLQYTWAPQEVVYSVRYSIAVALQRENARILSYGLRRDL
jgi:hypothetical protein